ncbi:cutinase transcription factor 1 alpha [Microthyrium microscopicum]|uniref:Cutinase transcription factor 1 alpha n=1 Tax=Microthyrium microscopicum TaxID=703497 RepID=A0A6A6TYN7_9PEZI|nr:cutinase transcription factor 1 alpha [Microthyrium microscopicum]
MSESAFMSVSADTPPANSAAAAAQHAANAANPSHPSFRRQRASRACEVRCDAASLGVPCTNCTAFGIECRIPTPKRKKAQSKAKDGEDEQSRSPGTATESPSELTPREAATSMFGQLDGTPTASMSEAYATHQSTHNGTLTQFMKPKFARAPIKEAGRVAYLGESSNLSLLVHDRYGASDVVHYPLPENVRGAKARVNELDNMEIEILHQRGAFLLPPRALCDELVEAYFKWVAPVVPVINRSRFMRQYRDPKNPPSLLLLQAILLAGSRVCMNPQLMDSSGSTTPAAMTFYKRAKALFDANYEDDRVTIVQALLLLAWYWEGPEDVTKNVFYWTRVAIVVAQGSGMHRSVEGSQLSRSDKRLWKRIWWTLFSRDRSVAVALGRPVGINPEDTDVEMIHEDDFIEDEPDRQAEFPPDPIHVRFFISYVKLCEIMGLVLSQQYSVASKLQRTNAMDLTHSDMALADWFQHCPKEVSYDKNNHNFWAALLHSNYYTTLCLLHRAHMPPAGSPRTTANEEAAYPSRNIAYQAAGMITSIVENLQNHGELRYTPAFIVYSLFSALIMHVYQMRSSNKIVVAQTEQRLQVCMIALKEVSKVWLVAKMVHTLFESILGNKSLEERLQKAAGKRHKKPHPINVKTQREEAQKRKFDEMDLNFTNGPPAPPVSYERSRPQTPALTPSQDTSQPQTNGNHLVPHSPQMARQQLGDGFPTGQSRGNTRPTTPFNANFSYPGTPPELFLVTRNSPNIPSDLWQNFQPDQLFPAETNLSVPFVSLSPIQQQTLVDPQLSGGPQQSMMQATGTSMNMQPNGMMTTTLGHEPNAWAHMDGSNQQNSTNDDSWSNSSKGGGPIVPQTLNVEDWFNFFGIQGETGLSGF